MKMKIVLSTIGTFHSFDLARQLDKRDALSCIFTGYPIFKLRNECLSKEKIRTFPWLQAPYMKWGSVSSRIKPVWERWSAATFDSYVARNLPECDLFCGLSGSATKSGRVAKQRGFRYVCDRGSSHISFQDQILREEFDRHGLQFAGIEHSVIERERAEYENADAITVPSTFALETFLQRGIKPEKLKLLPYGVDLSRFKPVWRPPKNSFHVLFVGGLSIRKGIRYLIQAFDALEHANKHLTFAGSAETSSTRILRQLKGRSDVTMLGHVPQSQLAELMSRSHVMVLPSIEEGLALVQAQAMACRCPVIASANTGAADLFTNGKEGFITPIRDAEAIACRLQQLADDPDLRESMGEAALQQTRLIGGWDRYGEMLSRTYA
jgi:alpha-maltose-1-phosphate synthase